MCTWLMEELGVAKAVQRVLETTTVGKAPGLFLFSADIGVKISKEEARQRSGWRGVVVQEEGENVVELLDRERGSYFFRGGICYDDSSRPVCGSVCKRTW
jgi:hypothetical protein